MVVLSLLYVADSVQVFDIVCTLHHHTICI